MGAPVRPWVGIARFGGIGDNLIASSVLPLLARDYNVEVITQAPQSAVFENNPHVHKLSLKKEGEIPTGALEWQRWFHNREGEFEKLINLSHSCEFLVALSPGQSQYYWPKEWRQKHCNKNYLEVVHDIVGVPHEFNPRFYPTEEEVAKAVQTKARVGPKAIGWCISGSRLDKVYPHAPLAIARLIRETGLPVILFGAPKENEIKLAKDIRRHVLKENGSVDGLEFALPKWRGTEDSDPIIVDEEEAAVWPIRRSLSLLQQCDLVISPDSGLAWGVAMESMPKIMLLSHASPENITKHWTNTITLHTEGSGVPCWPCHRLLDDPKDCMSNKENTAAACISSISVETIVAMSRQALEGA